MPSGVSVLDLPAPSGGLTLAHFLHAFTVNGVDSKVTLQDVLDLLGIDDFLDLTAQTELTTAQKDSLAEQWPEVFAGATSLMALTTDLHFDYVDVSTGEKGGGSTRSESVFSDIARYDPKLTVILGDIFDRGSRGAPKSVLEHLKRVIQMIPGKKSAVMGNHDNGRGDSITDCTPEDVNHFYESVGDSFVFNTNDDHPANELGYYHFEHAGINFIVLNAVVKQAPTEGDYGMGDAQKVWLTNTLAGITEASAKLIVLTHIDPTHTASAYFRMLSADRTYIKDSLRNWVTGTSKKILGVLSGHEHGINNSDANRVTVENGIPYANLVDGRKSDGTSAHIKAEGPDSGAVGAWWLVYHDTATDVLTLKGQNGAGDVTLTPGTVTAPTAPTPPTLPADAIFSTDYNGSSDYTDTGILPDNDTVFTVYGSFDALTAAYQFHGVTQSSGAGSDRFYFGISNTDKWCLGYDTLQVSTTDADTDEHLFEVSSAGLKVDGVLVVTNSETITQGDQSIHLGAHMNDAGTVNLHAAFNLKWANIEQGGVTHQFLPHIQRAQTFDGKYQARTTGISPDNATVYTVVGKFTDLTKAGYQLHGSSASNGDRFFFGVSPSKKWVLGFDTLQVSTTDADELIHYFEVSSAGLKVDGVLVVTNTETITAGNPIQIGAHYNGADIVNLPSAFEMYQAGVDKSGTLTLFNPE